MRHVVEVQHLQLSEVNFNNRRNDVGASAALDRQNDLLRRLVDRHVIDDDVVVGGPH